MHDFVESGRSTSDRLVFAIRIERVQHFCRSGSGLAGACRVERHLPGKFQGSVPIPGQRSQLGKAGQRIQGQGNGIDLQGEL